jgi:hypothetical protein
MAPLALVLVLLADVPPPRVHVRDDACHADDECVVSTFAGCCGACCPAAPRAVRAATLEQERARCAVASCAAPRCGGACAQVEEASAFVAACEAGQCVARRRAPRPADQCRADEDCVVASATPPGSACEQSACGCCSGEVVVPRASVPLARPARSRTAPTSPPKFGLGTGQAPQCAPCPRPPPVRAACVAGRCVGAPLPFPPPPG